MFIYCLYIFRANYLGEILPGQQQNQQSGLGLVQQQQQHQQHHHLSSCMSTMQLKSTAERDNRRNHQVYTSSPVKQENHKSNDHGSGSCSFFFNNFSRDYYTFFNYSYFYQ